MLDEPTDLPDGEDVELVPLDEVLASGGDYLDDDERRRLHESIEGCCSVMARQGREPPGVLALSRPAD